MGARRTKIEQIARYLLTERGLHTIVKLTLPCLQGDGAADPARRLGFREIQIADRVLSTTCSTPGVALIRSLRMPLPTRADLWVKLSNTLAWPTTEGAAGRRDVYVGAGLYRSRSTCSQLAQEFGAT